MYTYKILFYFFFYFHCYTWYWYCIIPDIRFDAHRSIANVCVLPL